jgi:hypothetical protein
VIQALGDGKQKASSEEIEQIQALLNKIRK